MSSSDKEGLSLSSHSIQTSRTSSPSIKSSDSGKLTKSDKGSRVSGTGSEIQKLHLGVVGTLVAYCKGCCSMGRLFHFLSLALCHDIALSYRSNFDKIEIANTGELL